VTRHIASCPLCEATCGIVVETEGEGITSIRGDADDAFSRGHICPKAVALQDLHTDPDRLRRPVKRTASGWQTISWDEAFALVEAGVRRVQAAHGRDAVATYLGNPTVHSMGAMLFAPTFTKVLRSKNRYSATSVDQLPHHLAALWMFGHPLLIPIPDLERTGHLLIFGANPAVSNGSLMTAPDAAKRLKEIRTRGGRVIVVDPRRTETAALADTHHFIRPGADAWLLLALLQVIFAEGLERTGRVSAFTDGLDDVRALVAAWTPERVAVATGLAADAIRTLAREFAAAPTAAAYGRVGVSMQEFGGLACWLITVLNVVTGRLDEPGGVMFTKPAVDLVKGGGMYGGSGRFGRWTSRVRGLPEFAGELPVSALAEEMDTAGDGQIRGLITHAGNPVLSTPNGARLDAAIAGLEFYAAIDFYINETTRHAHVILPPTAGLERAHYDLVFHTLAIRNTAKYAPAVMPHAAGAKHDWEILLELIRRFSGESVRQRLKATAMAAIAKWRGPRGILDGMLRAGPYRLTIRDLERAPHGLDLGPLASALPGRLKTPDQRIALAPSLVVADVARAAAALDTTREAMRAAPDGSLALVGRRELRSGNSWMHNSERLVRGRRRCTLLMHETDAAARALHDGDQVRVRSRTGTIVVELETTTEIMPGVVSLPHGWGHARDGVRQRVAHAAAGESINDLTDDQRIDTLTGNAGFSGVRVQVERTVAVRAAG
jgi:anaerobic selenocysteine-containing dehydrogenase